jgi:hypothetical protein
LDLDKKEADIQAIAKKAIRDKGLCSQLMQNLLSKKDTIRFNSFEAIKHIAETNPDSLYPHWDFFVELLGDENNYRKFIAVHILARLVKADHEGRFEKILDQYYDLLGASVIVAGHITELSAKIVKAKPKLEPRITARLLDIDSTTQKHKDLIKAGAIDSFMEYYETAEDKEGIIEFVKGQLQSTSPKTKKKAKQFFDYLEER